MLKMYYILGRVPNCMNVIITKIALLTLFIPHSWGNWGVGGHPQPPAKGASPLSGESREARPFWWGSGGYPPDSLPPPSPAGEGGQGDEVSVFSCFVVLAASQHGRFLRK